ncbi:hypothetical protein, partial [Desulfovibrio sp.]|uniref:hypothetical protein n=1 Tax=Desulfovibrio sp. TaxID=885 RepID=UPI003FD75C81
LAGEPLPGGEPFFYAEKGAPAGRQVVKNDAGGVVCGFKNPASPELARTLANCLSWRRLVIFYNYFKML